MLNAVGGCSAAASDGGSFATKRTECMSNGVDKYPCCVDCDLTALFSGTKANANGNCTTNSAANESVNRGILQRRKSATKLNQEDSTANFLMREILLFKRSSWINKQEKNSTGEHGSIDNDSSDGSSFLTASTSCSFLLPLGGSNRSKARRRIV